MNFSSCWLRFVDECDVVVSHRVVEMFAGQLFRMKKAFFIALVFLAVSSQLSRANSLVDLHMQHPLGVLSTSASGHQIYFSLGNGRAIAFFIDQANKNDDTELQKLLFKTNDKALKARPVRRRNIKW